MRIKRQVLHTVPHGLALAFSLLFLQSQAQTVPQKQPRTIKSTGPHLQGRHLVVPNDPFVQLQHCPQGNHLFSLHELGSVVFWDNEGHTQKLWKIKNVLPETAVCTGDEKWLLVGYQDGFIRIWNTQTGQKEKEWKGHNGPIYSMVLFDRDQQLATGGEDGSIQIWDVSTAQSQKILVVPTWNPEDEVHFLHPRAENSPTPGVPTYRMEHQTWQPPRSVLDLTVTPSGERIAAIGPFGRVLVWETTPVGTEPPKKEAATKDERILWHVLPSPDNKALGRITLSEDGHHVVLRATFQDPLEIHEVYGGHLLSTNETFRPTEWNAPWAFSPTKSQYFGISEEAHIPVVKDIRGEKFTLRLRGLQQSVRVAVFSPQGQWVGASGKDPRVCLWETNKGTLVACGKGHQATVDSLDFSPTSKTLASIDVEKEAYLWYLPQTRSAPRKP